MSKKFKVGIAGIGFVGGSMLKSFQEKEVEYIVNYDKFKESDPQEKLLTTDILFLSLPTQYDETTGEYNKDTIVETCSMLELNKYKGAVVLKSTVEPETTSKLEDKFNLNFIHNPEFLTARTAYEDFHNQKHIVLGKSSSCDNEVYDNVVNFYKTYYPKAVISECTSIESESMKIFVNCFYSVKVQFFNEIYLTCQKSGANYDIVKDLMICNNWINPAHTTVPGPDGELSYGGMCFPKDTNALLKYMQSKKVPSKVLEATIEERDIMRDDNVNIIKKN